MARDFQKFVAVGRLTRDPEIKVLSGGGKLARFGLAISNSRKNAQTGEYEDNACFIDCEAWNRGEMGKTADVIEQYVTKGQRILVEGRIDLDQWDDKETGAKRSKHKLTVDTVQFLEPKTEGATDRPAAKKVTGPVRNGGSAAANKSIAGIKANAKKNATPPPEPAQESMQEPDGDDGGIP